MILTRKEKIAACFGKASDYDQAAHIQKEVARRLAGKIKAAFRQKSLPRQILEFGCGTGFLTEQLVKLFPEAHIRVTDLSSDMLNRTKGRLQQSDRRNYLDFQVMDGENPPKDQFYDLICSSLSLQWFTDRRSAMAVLIQQLKPDGQLIVSTLCQNSFQEWRDLYAEAGLICPLLDNAPIEVLETDWPLSGQGSWQSEDIIDYPESGFSFLKNLKKIGASLPKEGSSPLSFHQLSQLLKRFDEEKPKITYQIGYGLFRKKNRLGVFVTGTDTGIGKTFTAACLVKAWQARYWKPIQTGLAEEAGDSATVAQLVDLPTDHILPPAVALSAPLSPAAAAHLENYSISDDDLRLPKMDNEPLVIEGAGGLMVPITANKMMIDLIKEYGFPAILVARSGLGTINHTLLSLEALRNRDIPIAGVIMCGVLDKANKQAIEFYGKVKVIAEIPFLNIINDHQVSLVAQKIPTLESLLPKNS
ncbi:MAG: dethiobiotin synthase [Zymomonas mobilis subsp. pomaceae]|uniref:dethiobiotin synthase n=1 Tax=Zymomonas mobilis TaxID=542 RepID=UPI0039E87C72